MALKLITYLQESREEMKRVIWPSRKDTVRNTILVIGISLAVAAFLGVLDFLLNIVLQSLIQ